MPETRSSCDTALAESGQDQVPLHKRILHRAPSQR